MREPCILIFRLGSIGDTVVALPCFHAIARRFADSRRVLLTNALASTRTSSAESVLGPSGLIDETLYYPSGESTLRQMMWVRREIRRLRPAALVYLAERHQASPVYRDIAFFKAAGVPRIIGAPLTRSVRECATDPRTQQLEFEVERLARALRPEIPVSLHANDWDLRLTRAELARAEEVTRPLDRRHAVIAIAPGTKVAAKDWGANNWSTLIAALAAVNPEASLVVVGSGEERESCEKIAAPWRGPRLNLCGSVTPRETAAVLRGCTLLICHDSGPMHLAAAQQIPCVALFGNYNRPRKWYPFGCGHRVVRDERGVRAISVQQVLAQVSAALGVPSDRDRAPRDSCGRSRLSPARAS